uniref:exodeoxyribonuclease III n=1 Tax=Amphiprion ocellaris TaxID=80972 RepID=A0AAQ5XER2_AMPOC
MNHPIKCNKILSHLHHLKGNVVFLQETHLKNSDHQRLKRSWVGQIFHSKFNSRARGTAILIDKNTPFIVSNTITDSNGRYIIVTGSLYNTPLILANIYAPNWDNHKFYSDLLPQVDSHYLILGGDMNMVMNPVLDRSSNKPVSISRSAQVLHSYLKTYGAVDI